MRDNIYISRLGLGHTEKEAAVVPATGMAPCNRGENTEGENKRLQNKALKRKGGLAGECRVLG